MKKEYLANALIIIGVASVVLGLASTFIVVSFVSALLCFIGLFFQVFGFQWKNRIKREHKEEKQNAPSREYHVPEDPKSTSEKGHKEEKQNASSKEYHVPIKREHKEEIGENVSKVKQLELCTTNTPYDNTLITFTDKNARYFIDAVKARGHEVTVSQHKIEIHFSHIVREWRSLDDCYENEYIWHEYVTFESVTRKEAVDFAVYNAGEFVKNCFNENACFPIIKDNSLNYYDVMPGNAIVECPFGLNGIVKIVRECRYDR